MGIPALRTEDPANASRKRNWARSERLDHVACQVIAWLQTQPPGHMATVTEAARAIRRTVVSIGKAGEKVPHLLKLDRVRIRGSVCHTVQLVNDPRLTEGKSDRYKKLVDSLYRQGVRAKDMEGK